MRRAAYIGLIAMLGCSVLGALPASATFPGSNGKIAFGVFWHVGTQTQVQIGVMEEDGSGRDLLTSTLHRQNYEPAWSADGSKIAFVSVGNRRHSLPKLRTMNADGTGLDVTLSDRFLFLNHPSWSPDGSKIVFCGQTSSTSRIFTINADGTGLDRVTRKGHFDRLPDWSPDGASIAFSTYTNSGHQMIATMDPDGSNRQFLDAGFGAPSWSPDGGQLVFTKLQGTRSDVFVMNADGTGVTAVTATPHRWEYTPTFSPDGTKIAFSRTIGVHPNDTDDIWIVTVPGGAFTRVTDTPKRDEFQLSWQAT